MRFQWLDRTRAVLRPALAHGRDLVKTHQPTHVLMDFTGLPPIAVQDELWLSVHWFPRVAAQPLRCVALVLRPTQLHNQMATEAVFWLGRHLVRFQLHQVFDDVPAALDWRTAGDAAAVRRLQAEWNAGPPPAPAALPT